MNADTLDFLGSAFGAVLVGLFIAWVVGKVRHEPLSTGWKVGIIVVVLGLALTGASQTTPGSPPTDAYGYTAAERQSLYDGLLENGLTATEADCVTREVERTWTPDETSAFGLEYARTGTVKDAAITLKLGTIFEGCVGSP
jgi:hypothetical protein